MISNALTLTFLALLIITDVTNGRLSGWKRRLEGCETKVADFLFLRFGISKGGSDCVEHVSNNNAKFGGCIPNPKEYTDGYDKDDWPCRTNKDCGSGEACWFIVFGKKTVCQAEKPADGKTYGQLCDPVVGP
uniref:Uncharacterized protein n=1 Tax=Grammatophora oceanica TaxID=210454 RepID=A0A7S1UQX0_9STRA|mmetsp:Transcript_18199/g.27023  ORF Transcript_18199/g.27023 Transcript_18199/m.27023 type:complete len:132 (+) Transcript_18199:230-625(+)|eukprot:CAMPEP_0194026110 /NCGR_PEP_ID=MMETSP0009_2-20130614/424_1 /TAXON_ID=210454 /ORGANISM="Grammatophora oceanica, Strain CCMP 410" /LENGTH=131 /DNA_ID=CAMNT_0038664639 /DNA_START=203 /DNA_END=598 /DNA_ORIENTATION=-